MQKCAKILGNKLPLNVRKMPFSYGFALKIF